MAGDSLRVPGADRGPVRRGRLINVSKVVEEGAATGWHIDDEARYTQVAVAGRAFPRDMGPGDNARPSLVEGVFTDTEIVSIVSFIRTSPEPPPKPLPDGTIYSVALGANGASPIGAIQRKGRNEVVVTLVASDRHGETVSLRRSGARWRLVQVSFWIA